MTTIDDLTRLVPPPAEPYAARGDWTGTHAALDLALPLDYEALVERYGAGAFADITLLTPFDKRPYANLVTANSELLTTYGAFRAEFPGDFPHPLHPEPGGLLVWASTGNGESLCWLTEGEPADWPVVVWEAGYRADRYDLGAVALLHGYLGGGLAVDQFGPAPAQPWFEGYRERAEVYVKLGDPAPGEPALEYPERLRILRETLAPTADRGSYDSGRGQRQDHFKATDRDWLLTYETAYGHQLRVAFPPGDDARARATVTDAVRAMGCTVVRVLTPQGEPAWPVS